MLATKRGRALLVAVIGIVAVVVTIAFGQAGERRADGEAEQVAVALTDALGSWDSTMEHRRDAFDGDLPPLPTGTTLAVEAESLVARTTVRAGPAVRCVEVRADPTGPADTLEVGGATTTAGPC